MRCTLKQLLLFCLIGLLWHPLQAFGKDDSTKKHSRPKIGLALSGGGAKGFAHVGVLKKLEELQIPVDYVTGTSMGAIIGGLYATGYSTDDLQNLAREVDWNELFDDSFSRQYLSMVNKRWDGRYLGSFPIGGKGVQLPSGLIAGQKISSLLTRLTTPVHHIHDFRELPIPFLCVATNIENGNAVQLDSGFLPDALRASMSIPTAFTPIVIDSMLLVDGGVARNLPVQDAFQMGADIVIAVDVGSPLLPAEEIVSFVDIIDQSIGFMKVESTMAERAMADMVIVPDLKEFTFMDFNDADTLIARGEQAIQDVLPQLQALSDSLRKSPNFYYRKPPPATRREMFFLRQIKIEGLKNVSPNIILAELDLEPPDWVSSERINDAVEQIYAFQFFDRVTYKLEPHDTGTDLIIRVVENETDLLRFGLNYDSIDYATILLNASLRNLGWHGSHLNVDLSLSSETQVETRYFTHTGFRRKLGLQARLRYVTGDRHIYDQRSADKLDTFDYDHVLGELFIGSLFSSSVEFGAGVRREYVNVDSRIEAPGFGDGHQHQVTLFATLWLDRLDRAYFPHRGQAILCGIDAVKEQFWSDATFTRFYFNGERHFPLHPRSTLSLGLHFGSSNGDDLPLNYLYTLGGLNDATVGTVAINSFYGIKSEELYGNHVEAIFTAFQYEFLPRKFISFHLNFGKTTHEQDELLDLENMTTGWGLTVGTITPFGPISGVVMGSNRHDILTFLSIGFRL